MIILSSSARPASNSLSLSLWRAILRLMLEITKPASREKSLALSIPSKFGEMVVNEFSLALE